MRKLSKIFISLILTAVTLLSVGTLSYAVSNFTTKSQFTGKTYIHYGAFAGTKVKDMIDVSEHNGLINWYKIKALGIDDAIVRVGYRGYATAGNMYEDKYFADNVEGAVEAGVNVGIYFYSQALTPAEAVAEANFVLKRVKNYKISLPIFFDYEFAEVSTGRLDRAWANGTLNKTKMTANVIAFCDAIKKAGYKAGLYSSSGFFTYQYNADTFLNKDYTLWNAYYTTNSTYGNFWPNKHPVYTYWQYGGDNVQGCCGAPSVAWLKVKYGSITGYVSSQYIDFVSANIGKSITEGLNVRAGASTSYASLTKVPKGGKVTILSYPTDTNTDLNFYYYTGSEQKPNFILAATQNTVTVSWKKMAGYAFYRVYAYNASTKKYERLVQSTGTSFTVKDLNKNTAYTFLVRAFVNADKGTAYTVKDNKTITTATDKPAFKMSHVTGTTLTLAWNKVTGASFYRVYSYNAATKKYERLAQTTALSYKLTGLKNNTNYPVLVRAFNKNEVGSDYNASDVKTFTTTPAAPNFTLQSFSYSVRLKWNACKGADFYRVYLYHPNTKQYTRLAQVEGTAWEDGPIKANTSYTYLVRAFFENGYGSDYTVKNHKSITTLPAKPQFSLQADENNNIRLDWNKIGSAAYYRVYTYNTQTKKYTRIAQTSSLTYTYAGEGGMEYTFLVRAFRANGEGSTYSVSNHKSITTAIAKAHFSLRSDEAGSVAVSWSKVKDAAYYRVYSYDVQTGKYQRLCQTTALQYRFANLDSGEEYTFLVRAFSKAGMAAEFDAETDNRSVFVM